jgi:gas vesicle protein
MAIGLAAGAIVGGLSSIFGARDAAKRQRAQIRANRMAAKHKYSATLDSTNIMKAAVRESTRNAVGEILRVGAADVKEVQKEVTRAASTLAARSEGLTSGRSKGREMIGVMVKGNELRQKMENKTTSMINQVVDAQDAKTNELNNRLLRSYQEMSAVLSSEGPDLGSNVGGFLSGAMSGAQSGLALESAIG